MKVLRIIISVLLTIIFSFVLIGTIYIISFNSFISKNNMKMIVNEIGVEEFIGSDNNNIITINGVEYNAFDIPEMQEVYKKYFDVSIDYIFGDGKEVEITDEDIYKIVNSDYYKKELGINLNDKEKEEIFNEMKLEQDSSNDQLKEELKRIRDEFGNHDSIKILKSTTLKVSLTGMLILVAVLIGLCRWSFYKPLVWIGTGMVTSSLLAIGSSLLLKLIALSNESERINIVLIKNLFNDIIYKSLIFLAVGILFIVSYIVITKKISKNKLEENN